MARSQIPFIVQTTTGDVVSGATVTVNVRGAGAAMVYAVEDAANVTTIANPVTTSALGAIPGWVEEGSYTITVSGPNLTTYNKTIEIIRGDATVGTTRLANLGVTTAKLADLSVTNVKLADSSIGASKITDATITGAKLVAGAVGTAQLLDTGVTNAKLASGAVTQAKVAAGAIGTAELIDSNVTNIKLASASVTLAKMAVNAVDSTVLADNAVIAAKIAPVAKTLLVPTGAMYAFPAATIPTGWLLCDGTPISRTIYAALFAVIGTTYGAGDGTTTFNLPDLKDRTPVGKSSTIALASTGGSKTHSHTGAAPDHLHSSSGLYLPDHSHNIPGYPTSGENNNTWISYAGGPYGLGVARSGHNHTWGGAGTYGIGNAGIGGNTGGSTGGLGFTTDAPSSVPPYVGMNWIINTGLFA